MAKGVDGFDWDAGTRAKCQKHGVSIAAMEGLFAKPIAILPDPQHSDREKPLKAIGFTEKAGRSFWSSRCGGAAAAG